MGFHTYDVARADNLEEAAERYRFLSVEELVWALSPTPDEAIVDLGSGTGFYTDDIAAHAKTVYAVDIQSGMHEYYRAKGVPENVELVTSGIDDMPFADASIDGAVSTMTYHEFATDEALSEVARILKPGATVAIVDWAATGSGEHGPPVAERFHAADAAATLREAGFTVSLEAVRPETFLLVATCAE